MLHDLLCWVGIHAWIYRDGYGKNFGTKYCRNCGKDTKDVG